MKFKYTTVDVSAYCQLHNCNFVELLNDFGVNGWEVVHIHYSSDLPYEVVFKTSILS